MTQAARAPEVRSLVADLCARRVASRLWARDVSLWASAGAPAEAAIRRLGWLKSPGQMGEALPAFVQFARELHREQFARAYLLGMGGSSLCVIVLRQVLGLGAGGVDLTVVDTTDERSVRGLLDALDPRCTLVLVSSKSGTTVEVDALARLFDARLRRSLDEPEVARRFIVLTDPGTPLEQLASARGYRRVFHTLVDVGGRFSAISPVGLLPAALMGQPLEGLVRSAQQMADRCRADDPANPGLALAAFLAAGARAARDKLTLLISESLASLGLWIEQLVAESTGKQGRGLLPVVDEGWDPASYGTDRVFVVLRDPGDEHLAAAARELTDQGHPVWTITTSAAELGGEFFRWEFAIAIVGVLLEVNPFDEPDVEAAKARTAELLATYERTGCLPGALPEADIDGVAVRSPLTGAPSGHPAPAEVVRTALATLRPGDYVAWLSYLSPEPAALAAVERVRRRVARRTRAATVIGLGPRYLHSTGQYHKGGPNRGIFFLLTADDPTETVIPGRPYSLAILKRAQALGDYLALVDRGRRVVWLHCPVDPVAQAAALERVFDGALG
jgi:glucose-6-phosphate isomerase